MFFNKVNTKKQEVEELKNKYLGENKDEKIELKLSLKPSEEIKTSKVVRDVYMEEIRSFNDIEDGDLNISTSYVFSVDEGYEASVYLRNATKFEINLDNPCLIVVDENGKIILKKVFKGEDLGTLQPYSARPWKLLFDKTYLPESVDLTKAKVNFWVQKPFADESETSVGFREIEDVNDEKSIEIIDYNNRLPLLKENEVNFNLSSLELVDGFLSFNLIIRNSTESTLVDPDTLKPLVENLPVAIYKDDVKVYSEVVRVPAIVGAYQAKFVPLSTAYKTDSLEGITLKLNEI
ncbi:MAG: SLAP domain-containing protein [Clostridium sp.]|uniref:SLAP domain-containing protein n=1 Tax=Clostridium sp. TaxID=1506 RepID=UPI002FC6691E